METITVASVIARHTNTHTYIYIYALYILYTVYSLWALYKALDETSGSPSALEYQYSTNYYASKWNRGPHLSAVGYRDQTVSTFSPTSRWCQRVLEDWRRKPEERHPSCLLSAPGSSNDAMALQIELSRLFESPVFPTFCDLLIIPSPAPLRVLSCSSQHTSWVCRLSVLLIIPNFWSLSSWYL